ncbi:MAG TPA: glycerol-3-phosphate acyltransferase [Acidimicrobiales bacterium]|nr:glycerol-3-phosphate acyltransferase [Acidimicrobiales bacterium]
MPVASLAPGGAALLIAASYLVGTFPTALLVAGRRGVDPTRAGSGNPGATNVARTAGRRAGAVVLVGDAAKGALPAAAGWALGGHGVGVACGVAAVVGHVLPITRGFRGGKGVATGAGMAAVLHPLAALAAVAAFGLVVAGTRIVSAGSIAATAVLPAVAAALGAPGREVAGLALCAALVVARHRDNLRRLREGREPRVGAARARPPGGGRAAG